MLCINHKTNQLHFKGKCCNIYFVLIQSNALPRQRKRKKNNKTCNQLIYTLPSHNPSTSRRNPALSRPSPPSSRDFALARDTPCYFRYSLHIKSVRENSYLSWLRVVIIDFGETHERVILSDRNMTLLQLTSTLRLISRARTLTHPFLTSCSSICNIPVEVGHVTFYYQQVKQFPILLSSNVISKYDHVRFIDCHVLYRCCIRWCKHSDDDSQSKIK